MNQNMILVSVQGHIYNISSTKVYKSLFTKSDLFLTTNKILSYQQFVRCLCMTVDFHIWLEESRLLGGLLWQALMKQLNL